MSNEEKKELQKKYKLPDYEDDTQLLLIVKIKFLLKNSK